MKTCVLLAPGPSLTREQAHSAEADLIGAVGNAFELRPDVDFIAATDAAWWEQHPHAKTLPGLKFSASAHVGGGVRQLSNACYHWNSGVLALEVAARFGATHVELFGFDMHGSHFFGPYTNGLSNTKPERRRVHQEQYQEWKSKHPHVIVVNRTVGSVLEAFPYHG